MARRYFGTDGVRGRVGESPITPDFVMRLGYAAGKVFAQGTPKENINNEQVRKLYLGSTFRGDEFG